VKRWWWIGVLVSGLMLAGCSPADNTCQEKLTEAESVVHTDREFTAVDVPGIGEYTDIHWQVRAAGHACSRVPGPNDWHYQGLVKLTSADAAALLAAYDWQPIDPGAANVQWDSPAQMWSGLKEFAPQTWGWQHSPKYTAAQQMGTRWGTLYLDPQAEVGFFVLYDH